MPDESLPPVPLEVLWLIRLSSMMVPSEQRAKWRQHWENGAAHWWAFLCERNEEPARAKEKLLAYANGAARDAWRQRFGDEEVRTRVGKILGHPAFCLGALAVLLLAVGVLTGGFAGTRAAIAPPPLEAPENVATISQQFSGFGKITGVPPATFVMWQSCPLPEVAGLATYKSQRFEFGQEGKPHRTIDGMHVSPEFFDVLGVKAAIGRTFRREDLAGPIPVVLSYRSWQQDFDSDPSVLNRVVTLDGQSAVIVGVMPKSFWFLTYGTRFWTVLPPSPLPLVPPRDWRRRFIGVVIRIAPGAPVEAAERALQAVARGNRVPWSGSAAQVRLIKDNSGPSLYVGGAGLLLALLMLIASVIIPKGRFSIRAVTASPLRQTRSYWLFFLAKTALLLGTLTLIWVERTYGPRGALFGFTLGWVFLLFCLAAALLSILDQRRRCPVCLHRLSLPVSLGTWASALLDPASTELLCERGHGTLTVPETQTSATGPERWTAMDESWRELFTR
ncbi:MAG: ABC transporter permease [Bryobacteraceae bacterium]|jgi:hypothetical protein|nr:ABC transporter permease [Bryobacteraceae bacterium]